MTPAVLDRPGVVRVCQSCEVEFVDRSRTSPRTYCEDCSPYQPKRAAKAEVPAVGKLPGRPFTLRHFRAWSRELKLASGERFELEAWEAGFVRDLFEGMAAGWLKEAWLVVPEGNGKSTLIAVLILYCVEFSPEASIPVAASARDQANIIFEQGRGFVRRSPLMAARFECKPGLREVVFDEVSRAKIFASDAGTGDGIIPTPLEVIDELHRHKTLDLYRTWAGKLDKEDAVLVVISTAGEPGSEFELVRDEMRRSAVESKVRGCFGRYVGAASILHEYAVPEDGDVEDLRLVKAANPSSRITVATLRAKRARPSWTLPHWQRLTCNMPTKTESSAVGPAEWKAAATDERIPAGEPVGLGLDVAWKWDTTALVPLWMPDPKFRLLGEATILEPPRDGTSLDPYLVEEAILEVHGRNPLHTVVMDTTRAEQLAEWIKEETGATVVDRGQGNQFAVNDYERWMEALRSGWLFHCGHPGLTRHVLNAVTRMLPGGDARFDRPRQARRAAAQDSRVIDALTAAAMVHATLVAELTAPASATSSWRPL